MKKQFKNSTDILPSALDMYLPQVHPYNIILDYVQHIRSLRHVATTSFCVYYVYWFVTDVVHILLFVLRPCNELLLIFLLGTWIYRLVMLWTTAIHQVFLELPRLSKVTVRCLLHDFLQTGFGFWMFSMWIQFIARVVRFFQRSLAWGTEQASKDIRLVCHPGRGLALYLM